MTARETSKTTLPQLPPARGIVVTEAGRATVRAYRWRRDRGTEPPREWVAVPAEWIARALGWADEEWSES